VGVRVGAGHRAFGGPQVGDDAGQAARGQHPRPGEHVQVAGTRVLRQVSDAAGAGDPATHREGLAGQHSGHGRLAGAVAADQTDPVARRDPERRRHEERAGADA